MNIFAMLLLIATFLCGLMAGFLFAFSVVVMPGIKKLDDRDFLRCFQVIDRVIQNGQPLFMVVWLGSTLSLILSCSLSFFCGDGTDQAILVAAAIASVLLVQLPTMTINIPLNNTIQAVDFATLEDATARQLRMNFEPRWNRWNVIRTLVSCIILAALLATLFPISR